MEIRYKDGIVLFIHSELTEKIGIFHKWKRSHKRKSYLIRLILNTSLFFAKNHYFTLFSRIQFFFLFFFSLLQKPSCTDYVEFGKCQERFGRMSWSEKVSDYLDIKLKVIKREDKSAEFRLRQNFTIKTLISISLFDKEIN